LIHGELGQYFLDMRKRRLIERYIFAAIVPYTLLSLVLLTAILFAQQASRYAELIFHSVVPSSLVYSLSLSLIPAVLIFTLPVAVLSGTIIGFGRMGSDSEVVAMRAAGAGTWKMLWPALAIGLLATAAASFLNLKEGPLAQQHLIRVGIQAALYQLDSPVEPRTFTTDIPHNVIYVRDGDKAKGQWGRVFIYSQETDKTQLVTARSGRVDSSPDKSELVLQDAVRTQLPPTSGKGENSYAVERFAQLRVTFDTGRASLLKRLQEPKLSPDEMDWSSIRSFIAQSTGTEKREAQTTLHRRLTFSLAPFVFALFGSALALRVRRGGRGFGVLLSLAVLIGYYLVALAGDQMARAGTLPPIVGAWLATALMAVFGVTLLGSRRLQTASRLKRALSVIHISKTTPSSKPAGVKLAERVRSRARPLLLSFPSLLDVGMLRAMGLSFILGLIALAAIFNIFTLFELWRFIALNRSGVVLVSQYLFYLLPLVLVELCPGSVLVSALITYALTARRSEAIAWWATGQSVYRLMLPGIAFSVVIAGGSWFIQERVMPQANIRQDALRARIHGNIAQLAGSGRRWLVSTTGTRIYSYEFDDRRQVLLKPAIYDFDQAGINLQTITMGEEGKWLNANQMEIANARLINLEGQQVVRESAERLQIADIDPPSVFKPTVARPSQLSADSLRTYVRSLKLRGADTTLLAVALQRKYAGPFSVIVMALMGMPLAISFGRKSAVVALCSAVGVSLAFWLISGGFEQLGDHALLPAAVAAWAPLVIFAGSGLYFVSRVRT
jgi:LPS export ABC transporter permease LptF/LPS export ABC transporter permease LptG